VARLLLIGTGLIGASFALAVRRAGAFDVVSGFDVDAAALASARRAGCVTEAVTSIEAGAATADAVLVAVPPRDIVAAVAQACAAVGTRAVPVFDVGSVKAPVIAGLVDRLGAVPADFVPCHPMAGAETRGADAADASLFEGRRVFLTPTSGTRPESIERVSGYWRSCGASVATITAERHDAAVALTSHLPHLLAFAYMARVGAADAGALAFAGPGFRDFTRIAASDPALWGQILDANRAPVGAELDALIGLLERLREDLSQRREAALESILRAGQSVRRRFADGVD